MDKPVLKDKPGSEAGRPRPVALSHENIPAELKALVRWLVWSYVMDRDPETGEVSWDKPPRSAHSGQVADAHNRANWSSFAVALAAYMAGGLDGLGFDLFVEEGDDGEVIVGVDLDHCRDPLTGAIEPWAQQIIDELNSYTEVSPSGTGIRIFVWGRLPAH